MKDGSTLSPVSSELLLFKLIVYMEKSLQIVEGGDDPIYQDGYRDACLEFEEYIETLIKDMA